MRNEDDLECLACPPKYRELKTFHKYYTGAAVAPYPTLFSAPCAATLPWPVKRAASLPSNTMGLNPCCTA